MAEDIKIEGAEDNVTSDEAGKDAGTSAEAKTEETAEAGEQPSEASASGEQEEEDSGADTDKGEKGSEKPDDDEVVDGEFTSAGDKAKTGSFFKKKKDKKDEKIEELTDQVKRQMAEFDNFRKRTEKEKSQMFDMGARSVIEKILPVIDNFERGLAQAGDSKDDPFVQGMDKVYRQMVTELESIGVRPIEAEGKQFDPNLHNAVMHCEDDSVGENTVVQELQKGYTYHDAVVRHSMVKVAN